MDLSITELLSVNVCYSLGIVSSNKSPVFIRWIVWVQILKTRWWVLYFVLCLVCVKSNVLWTIVANTQRIVHLKSVFLFNSHRLMVKPRSMKCQSVWGATTSSGVLVCVCPCHARVAWMQLAFSCINVSGCILSRSSIARLILIIEIVRPPDSNNF